MEEKVIPANAPECRTGFFGGLYVRQFGPVEKGYQHDGHKHAIDHGMRVNSGSVRVHWRGQGKEGIRIVHAPAWQVVPAKVYHQITALEDGTEWECVFSEAEAERAGLNDPGVKSVPYYDEVE